MVLTYSGLRLVVKSRVSSQITLLGKVYAVFH